jgi:lipopolysaccharide heptosyltransferase I
MEALIVKPTAFGDVAQALLVVPVLKHSGLVRRLDWVVDEDYAPLVRACPEVDAVVLFPRRRWRRSWSPGALLRWARELRRRRYDLVLDLQGLARSALMARVARTGRRIGLASAREGAGWFYQETVADGARHAVDRYALAVGHVLGGGLVPEARPLPVPAAPPPDGLEPGRYIVVHPYSLWETKLWPWERYGALCRRMPEWRFVVIGEGPRFPLEAGGALDLRGRMPLESLMPLVAHAAALVGTDSGPAHVAALFGTPVVSVFGATDPEKTAPRGAGGRVLVAEGVACRPCLSRRCRAEMPMECMDRVGEDEVERALRAAVEARRRPIR